MARHREVSSYKASTAKDTVSMTPRIPLHRNLFVAIALVAFICLTVPHGAEAAPSLSVDLSHWPTTMPRNDEELNYVVDVKNEASADDLTIGDVLTCEPGTWFPGPASGKVPTLGYEWRRNGEVISGATASRYTVVGADAGKAIQCVVIGTNVNARTSFASLNPAVVDPKPSIAPPTAEAPTVNASRPTITDTGGSSRTGLEKGVCIPPTNWLGSPTYTYQWLLNGKPISTAEAATAEYQPVAADEGKILQCEVIGENAGGRTVGISNTSAIGTVSQPPNNGVAQTPAVQLNSTNGLITVNLELPEGTRAYAVSKPDVGGVVDSAAPEGWDCSINEAAGGIGRRVLCTRSDSLAAQQSYPGLEVQVEARPTAASSFVATATATGGGATTGSAQDTFTFSPATPFDLTSLSTSARDAHGLDYTQAGGHPFAATVTLDITQRIDAASGTTATEYLHQIGTDLPTGFLGNPKAAPECPTIDAVLGDHFSTPTCPRSSIVGFADMRFGHEYTEHGRGHIQEKFRFPIYMVAPKDGVPAQFALFYSPLPAVYPLIPRLRPDAGYALAVDSPALPKDPPLLGATVTFCSYGVKVVLGETLNGVDRPQAAGCKEADEASANPKPLLTNPTECSGQNPVTKVSIDSWEHLGAFRSREALSPLVTGCEKVPFSPRIDLQPTSHQADSPTGLDVSISVPTEGLETPTGISQSALKKAVVTLPKGMSVNPSSADGLGACALSQIKLGTNDPVECPDSSKVGTAEVVTPLLTEHLNGSVYLAKQGDNPFHSLLALYLVVESKERGILVKIPGRVDPRADGQLVATFDDNPQVPFSSLKLHFNEGNRAPLLNPPRCGSYGIDSSLSPYSAPGQPRNTTSTFQITEGPNGGPCPSGNLDPKLDAGLANPVAGSTSPFVLRLSRDDGTQRFKALDVKMPPGLAAYLKGVPYCPDEALAGISGDEGTGAGQIASPACPAASQIGTVSVGAGGGSNPFYVNTGKAYLAGPYKGAPLSIAIVTPAVAGPFDLGSVVVRSAAAVDPTTAQITVKSDPIPTVLHGIPLDVRDIRVSIDRPDFTLAPTNCEAMSVGAQVQGENGGNASVSNRFQVGECAALGFKPNLTLRLKGGTTRGKNPALTARVSYPKGAYANIKRVSVALPHSEFLDQSHIRTVCTRVQFAANACPKGSIYGRAEATSPLLGYKLTGPVYLRSSSHKLPDLVVALRGPAWQPLEIDLAGRIDSVRGGIRNRFEMVPDAPVSNFVLKMRGGKKGLLVNSRNICRSKSRATVKMDGQNGATHDFRPVLHSVNCKKAKKKKASRHGKKRAAARHRRG